VYIWKRRENKEQDEVKGDVRIKEEKKKKERTLRDRVNSMNRVKERMLISVIDRVILFGLFLILNLN